MKEFIIKVDDETYSLMKKVLRTDIEEEIKLEMEQEQDIDPQEILDFLNNLNLGQFYNENNIIKFEKSCSKINPYYIYLISEKTLYVRGMRKNSSLLPLETKSFPTHREALAYMKEHFKPCKNIYEDWCTVEEYLQLVKDGVIEELKTDDKVYVIDDTDMSFIIKRFFSGINGNMFMCFNDGANLWSHNDTLSWQYIKLPKE